MLQNVLVGPVSLIKGQVNTFAELPTSGFLGDLFVVATTTGVIGINRKVKGVYRWAGTAWVLANGIEANKVIYNNADSSLTASDVKAALDELAAGQSSSMTDAEIKAGYENNANTNAFTDAQKAKLTNIVLNQAIDLDAVLFNVALNNLKITNAAHTGDVTGSTALIIVAQAVTNTKLAHIPTSTVKGRLSAGTGEVEDVTVAALKTEMNITKSNVGLSAVQNINVKNDWTQNASKYIASSQIRAVDGNGLKLYNDAGTSGLLVTDSGRVEAGNGFKVMGDWFRVNGNSGIYWDNHGGGWNMEDSTYMRCYGNKLIYTANDIRGNRFVDNQNTNRYIDASGQSQLEGITFNGNLIARRTGFRGGDYSMIRYYQYAYNSSGNYATVHGAIDITCEQGWDSDNLMMRFNNQGYGNKSTYVYGNLQVTGSVSKGSGSFDIAHPDPKKTETHRLRHYFVETPSAGGNIYKYQLNCTEGDNYIALPDYFEHLNQDSLVWVNPVKHFGRAWGEVEPDNKRVKIVTEKKGIYNILIFGDRKDEVAMKDFRKYGIEYTVKNHT